MFVQPTADETASSPTQQQVTVTSKSNGKDTTEQNVVCEKNESTDNAPDGGRLAWLQVAGGFALFFNSWGIVSSYGVFQTYYQEALTDTSIDAIAWIGSIQSFLLLVIGLLIGPLYDAGYFRSLTLAGVFLVFLGFTMASISTRYWQVLLSQAFCVGLGAGCAYIPAMALIPQYFSRRRALATGIVATGSSIGGVVYPIIFQSLLTRVGYPWATRSLAFISLGTNAFAVAVLRPKQKTAKGRRVLLDLSAYRQPSFVLFSAANFFNYLAYMMPIYYLQPYALSKGMPDDGRSGLAYYLVAVINAGSVLGRILPAWLAGRFGPINALLGVGVVVTAVTMCWPAVGDAAGSVAFALFYGVASGGLASLPPTVVSVLVPDLSVHGTWLGMLSATNAISSLSGPPIAGAMIESTGSYLGVQLLAGFGMLGLTAFVLATRIQVAREGKRSGWIA
ncbi:Aspyridones efflux protein apdF [Colletotrichum sidae]|uniref:Aspyridones efflux protein apdF n=1 Tax=Colletotrichum sidae TaxID=1347389 RepID=A0A4R8PQK7_9PEZI|nr:Aspyridones efflux protein apdF [Colletotrichum sidae]